MNFLPQYTHIINSRLKHTYLTFDEEGNLIIKSPKVSQAYIEKLLLKKSVWINRSREKILEKKGKILDFKNPKELYLYGRPYRLKLEKYTKKRTKLIFEEEVFILQYSDYNEELFQKHVNHFYKEEAKRHIPSFVKKWSDIMELTPNKISFRKTKRQWGSCSVKNDLSFNTMMMKLPHDVIQYIIVHELAHIKHKHHQKSFWREVGKYMPDYKQHITELRKYSAH
jgi:predicted metal-dependent hydrolase